MKKTNVSECDIVDYGKLNMSKLQGIARKNVINMLKVPIILFALLLIIITSICIQNWILLGLAWLVIGFVIYEFGDELTHFKRTYKNELKLLTSPLVWTRIKKTKTILKPRPQGHFKQNIGKTHPMPTKLEIVQMKINEEIEECIWIVKAYSVDENNEYEFDEEDCDFNIPLFNFDEEQKQIKINELEQRKIQRLAELENLEEKDIIAAIEASNSRKRQFRSDFLYGNKITA